MIRIILVIIIMLSMLGVAQPGYDYSYVPDRVPTTPVEVTLDWVD